MDLTERKIRHWLIKISQTIPFEIKGYRIDLQTTFEIVSKIASVLMMLGKLILLIFSIAFITIMAKMIVDYAFGTYSDTTIASTYVNSISNITIALITLIYVFLTGMIIKQSKTEQKIRDIEKRLEEFYIPVFDILKDDYRDYTDMMVGRLYYIGEPSEINSPYVITKGLNDIRRYRYLAEESTSKSFMELIKLLENKPSFSIDVEAVRNVSEDLLENIVFDIKELEIELTKLKS